MGTKEVCLQGSFAIITTVLKVFAALLVAGMICRTAYDIAGTPDADRWYSESEQSAETESL